MLVAREGPLALLTINRPDALNALDRATLRALDDAVREMSATPDVRALVITGAGRKAFAAGADIGELSALSPVEAREYSRAGQRVFDAIERMGKPVIAAINGFALGGGCELAMACTLRIAADTAQLGQPEIDLGLIPGFAGTQRLSRLVGKGVALDLLTTGRRVSADEALRIGLVNRVVPFDSLMPTARALASELANKPAVAMRCIIESVHQGFDVGFDEAQSIEAALFGLVASTADMREGTAAFLDKRRPHFRGE